VVGNVAYREGGVAVDGGLASCRTVVEYVDVGHGRERVDQVTANEASTAGDEYLAVQERSGVGAACQRGVHRSKERVVEGLLWCDFPTRHWSVARADGSGRLGRCRVDDRGFAGLEYARSRETWVRPS